MPDLNLDQNVWKSSEYKDLRVFIAGRIISKNKSVNGAEDVFEILNHINKSSDFHITDWDKFLRSLSGNFGIIILDDGFLFAAVDISRTWPLFYSGGSLQNLVIYDRLPINTILTHNLNKLGANEFFELGYITGQETIYEGIYQLQSGQFLCAGKDSIHKERYFIYEPSYTPVEYNSEEFVNEFDKLLVKLFNQLLDTFPKDCQWVVPLSGGHDSRLVANCLKKAGAANVVCFSYGNPGNEQSEISKRVAEVLGYEWYFIEYNEEKWKKLHDSGIIDDYIDYAFNGVSTPHMQDLLAVYELKRLSLIEDSAIFVPGHTAISEVGFKVPDTFDDIADPVDKLIECLIGNESNLLETNILQKMTNLYEMSGNRPELISELFDWQENQAKYINNSLFVYRYLGYRTCIPLWDKTMADFWLALPDKLSMNREGLYEAEKHGVLIEPLLKIPYAAGKKDINIRNWKSFLKEKLKKIIPSGIKNHILKKSGFKSTPAEALNMVFAQKGETVEDVLAPIEHFPKEMQPLLENLLVRRPYQISVYRLAKFYTLKKLFEHQNIPKQFENISD